MADNNVPGAPRGGARLSATPMAQLRLGQRGSGDAPLSPWASGSVPGAPDGAAPPPEPFILDPDFRRLADAMPQMVWTAEPDGTLDHVNRALFRHLGADPAVPARYRWSAWLHPDDLAPAQAAWSAAVAAGTATRLECRLWHAAGRAYR